VLRTPEELLEVGLGRSRVVMANEAHNGMLRCVRTREVGRRLLPVAHRLGVRHLAMEALWDRELTARANRERTLPESEGYLGQPEMRRLVQDALDLGLTLVPYEAELDGAPDTDPMSAEMTSWREREQARNLAAALPDGPLLVWCGNSHLTKVDIGAEWKPMGLQFRELTGIEPFTLDQLATVEFEPGRVPSHVAVWLELVRGPLERLGGTAGFLSDDAPDGWRQTWDDAVLLSLDNSMS
jgi:hypothetical protein